MKQIFECNTVQTEEYLKKWTKYNFSNSEEWKKVNKAIICF